MDKDLTIKEICAMNTCDPNRPAILTGDWAGEVLNEPYRITGSVSISQDKFKFKYKCGCGWKSDYVECFFKSRHSQYFPYGIEL